MPERVPVGARRAIRPKTLTPVSRPIDQYIQPPRDTALSQLSSSLSTLVPGLSRFAGRLGEEAAAKDKEAGEAKAREMIDSGKTFAEAVRTGQIRPDQNPWFRVGFYETTGRVEGGRYIGAFLEALNQSPVAESVELDDFDAFEREFRSKYVSEKFGDSTSDFLANAFGTTVDAQLNGIRNAFAQQAGTRMHEQNKENFHSEIFQMVEEFRGTDFSTSERAAALRLAQERQVATGGMTYDQVNRMTASAIASAAVRLRDVEVLDLMDQIPTSLTSRGYLGGTSYGSELRENAELAIARAIDADISRTTALEKRRVETGLNLVKSAMIDALQTDPGADITAFVDQAQELDPDSVPLLNQMRDSVVGSRYIDDPDYYKELVLGIHSALPGTAEYTDQRDLDEALAARRLTPESYRSLSKDLQERETNGGSGKFLQHPMLTSIYNEVRGTFTSEFAWDTEANRYNANQAGNEARFSMLQWLIANPDATPTQMQEAKDNIANQAVRSRIQTRTSIETSGGELTIPKIPQGRFYVADVVQAGALQREFDEWTAGRRGNLSPQMLDALRKNKIDPTKPKDIEKFLKEQNDWVSAAFPRPQR
jgi:hypothetical protein